MEVSTETITNWETGQSSPKMNYYPAIIKFLGYFPFAFDLSILGNRIKYYRYSKGLSHRKLGELVNRDGSTIASWEKGESMPRAESLKSLYDLLAS